MAKRETKCNCACRACGIMLLFFCQNKTEVTTLARCVLFFCYCFLRAKLGFRKNNTVVMLHSSADTILFLAISQKVKASNNRKMRYSRFPFSRPAFCFLFFFVSVSFFTPAMVSVCRYTYLMFRWLRTGSFLGPQRLIDFRILLVPSVGEVRLKASWRPYRISLL